MVDLTFEELQAFNDTQREIIEKQQAEIERLRDSLVIANTTQANLHSEIDKLRGLLREAIQNPDIYGDEPATYDWIKRVREALGE